MQLPPSILSSKLRFSGDTECISRKRFNPLFEGIIKSRLTTIIAGAGYGKSTLASQAATHLELKTIWYRLDQYDRNIDTFLTYMIEGMDQQFHANSTDLKIQLSQVADTDGSPEQLMMVVLNYLESLPQEDYLIVFDDFHCVHEGKKLTSAIEFLLDNLPSNIHVIITSRSEPDLKLSHLKARRQILEISEMDLAFTALETFDLFSSLFKIELTDTTADELQQKTGGWVASLILLFHGCKSKTAESIGSVLKEIRGTSRDISSFLEENVFEQQPEEIKHFLLITSLLDRIDVRMCDRIPGITNSAAILSGLESNHLFTFHLDEAGTCYRYHQLFRDYLRKRLEVEYDTEEVKNLHRTIGHLFLDQGNKEDAFIHFLAGEAIEQACRILSDKTVFLMYNGYFIRIQTYLKTIPGEYFKNDPWMMVLKAASCFFSGNNPDALALIDSACGLFDTMQIPEGNLLGRLIEATIAHFDGDYLRTKQVLEKLISDNSSCSVTHIEIYGFLIQSASHLGDMTSAKKHGETLSRFVKTIHHNEIRNLAESYLNLSMAIHYLISGKFNSMARSLEMAEDNFGENALPVLSTQYYHITSLLHFYEGRYNEAILSCKTGINIVRSGSFQRFMPFAWLHLSTALAEFGLGNLESAREKATIAIRYFRKSGLRWGTSYGYLILHKYHYILNKTVEADIYLKNCQDMLEDLEIPYIKSELLMCAAASSIDSGDYDAAETFISQSETLVQPFNYHYTVLTFLKVRLYHDRSEHNKAKNFLEQALEMCNVNNYKPEVLLTANWNRVLFNDLSSVKAVMVSLCITSDDRNATGAVIQKLIHIETPVPQFETCGLTNSNSLQIRCFGTFRIVKGNTELPVNRWKNKTALLLLKYLIANRHRGYIPRDVLTEIIWPEQDPDKTANRLRVAVSALRRLLEPELEKAADSTCILTLNNSYSLDIGPDGSVDCDLFDSEIRKSTVESMISISHLLNAEKLYQGDFLQDDLYSDWCVNIRDHYKKQYLDVLNRIMTHYDLTGEPSRAIEYANKYISADPFSETVYRNLMDYYSKIDNKAMIQKTYARCKDIFSQELDCPVSERTEALFEALVYRG